MNNNMLSLSDEVIGKIIRELYTEYEINLLDQLFWEGHPFARDGFRFINVGEPLSEDALNGLIRFVSTLK